VGNDQIRARDGVSELMSCGLGADSAEAGRSRPAGRFRSGSPMRNGFPVTGSVSGQTTSPVTVSAKRRVKLKAKSFRVGANGKKTVKLKLPAALQRELKLSLRLTVKVKDPPGTTRTVKRKVTPKLKRR